jgi:hypothetical protein
MKKLIFIAAASILICAGCGKVDQNKAKTLVESLIHKIDSGAYSQTSNYYTEEFNASESVEARTEKYQKLKEATGSLVSLECTSVKTATDPDDRPIVELIYQVKFANITMLEAFSVVSQNGDLKVESHDIKQQGM